MHPFSLNEAYVKTGGLFGGHKKMLVYDHMGLPHMARQSPQAMWEVGPDGSYDALEFSQSYGGFRWRRNVRLAEELNQRMLRQAKENREHILRNRLLTYKKLAQAAGDSDMVAEIDAMIRRPNLGSQVVRFLKKKDKLLLKSQLSQRKQEEQRLKQAGIDLNKGRKNKSNK